MPSVLSEIIVHCGHHRCGTVWFDRIFRRLGRTSGLSYFRGRQSELPAEVDIVFEDHSEIDLRLLPAHRGSHIRRDPRDAVVSGYFYHLWAHESWLRLPRARLNGLSHQEKLKSLSKSDGLMLEIEGPGGNTIADMLAWLERDAGFLEVRYEDLVADEIGGFARIFNHYRLADDHLEAALVAVRQCNFERMTGRRLGEVKDGDHLRSGKPGIWRDHLENRHLALLEDMFGDPITALGYDPA